MIELRTELERRGLSIQKSQYTFGPLSSFVKEVFSRAEQGGIKGIGLLLLPFILLAVCLEWLWPPKRGNGFYVCGVKTIGRRTGGSN